MIKRIMMKRILLISLLVLNNVLASGQIDYNRQFFNAKQLFREGKYNLAMESFKPLIPYDQQNSFSEYASFYYALAAYHQKFPAVAKDQLNQIKKLHPKWDKMEEVNFWLAKIHLDNRDYFQGLKILSSIEEKKMEKDIEALKSSALSGITDVETLKMMREEYPKDEIVGKSLARVLSQNLSDEENKKLLESLISAYNFKRTDFFPEAPKTVYKDVYAVAVLMPFMINTLEPTASKKRNQIVLDFYEGMQLALDTLKRQGVKISLRAYDTQTDVTKIKNLLATPELQNADLLVGPFFQEENKVIQDFSLANKINVINPFSNNSEVIGQNPFAYLFQPSFETLGKRSGEFLASHSKKKNCMIIYGTSSRDSVMAANFSSAAQEKGLKIVSSLRVSKENAKTITTILATPTEFDDFKYPKEFSLKKDSIGSIFVASDEALIYSKVVGGVETRGDGIVVLGSDKWLDQTAIDLEKYQTLNIVLASPGYSNHKDSRYNNFMRAYIKVHGRIPSDHAILGYEFMLFTGNQLKQHGVYFQEALNKQNFIPGYLTEGFNFQFSRSNQYVPFVQFEDGVMKSIKN